MRVPLPRAYSKDDADEVNQLQQKICAMLREETDSPAKAMTALITALAVVAADEGDPHLDEQVKSIIAAQFAAFLALRRQGIGPDRATMQ
jgi:hypothetical protein